MPDGITAGPGFPPSGIQLGHLHFRTDENIVYQYKGGTPSVTTNWYPITGRNLAYMDVSDNTGEIPGDTNPYLIPFSDYGDSIRGITVSNNGSNFTIQQEGLYHVLMHSQISKTGGAGTVYVDQSPVWLT